MGGAVSAETAVVFPAARRAENQASFCQIRNRTENTLEDNKRRIKKSDWETLKWIYRIGKSQRWKILTIIIANAVSAVLTIVYANFSKNIINAAVIDKSIEKVAYYAVCFLILISVQLLLSSFRPGATESA
jgi:ABC-type bacteriocin/lantibiotic exporter with double-glycine peptidase domain